MLTSIICTLTIYIQNCSTNSGVGTYLSGTARAVPLLKVGRLVMHFAVPLFGHRLHIALMKRLTNSARLQVYMSNGHANFRTYFTKKLSAPTGSFTV